MLFALLEMTKKGSINASSWQRTIPYDSTASFGEQKYKYDKQDAGKDRKEPKDAPPSQVLSKNASYPAVEISIRTHVFSEGDTPIVGPNAGPNRIPEVA